MGGRGQFLRGVEEEGCVVLRILPRPGLLTGVVVAASVVGGVMFGAAAVSSGLLLRAVVKKVQGQ